tara:strand:- start:1494 stop:2057 length:564 start_codon:yes stop_codon:yes gene_type:complete
MTNDYTVLLTGSARDAYIAERFPASSTPSTPSTPDTVQADLIALCSELSSRFENKKRDNGDVFIVLEGPEDQTRESASLALRIAHSEELPNDWRYEVCSLACDAISEAQEGEELSEIINEVAENATTVYNSQLFSWYAENSTRLSYAEEAREEFGPSDEVLGDLHLGQYLAARETAQSFIDSLASSL